MRRNYLSLMAIGLVMLSTGLPSVEARDVRKSTKRELIYDDQTVKKMTAINAIPYQPCHIRFTDPIYGNLNDQAYFLEKHPFVAYCFKDDYIKFPKGTNVRFDKEKQIWVKDFSERSYADDAESYKKLDKASRVYNIQAKNSNGYVYTEDDLIGEEWRRDRNMYFCLLHPPKALCGGAPVMRLNDPKSNVLPFVMQILHSIEFIDDVPSEQAPVSPDADMRDQ